MVSLYLTAGDTMPTRLTYQTGKKAPINISGYTFEITLGYSTPVVVTADIIDPTGGVFEFPWRSGDLVEADEIPAEIVVTNAAGKTKTFPLTRVVVRRRI